MSGAAAGSNPTAQEDKKPEIDQAKTSQQPSQPNTLEEDDEFEDFPVEGELHHRIIPVTSSNVSCADVSHLEQTGHRRKPKYLEATHICGRRAGMTMMRMKTFRSN
jgi:hypothetical protein